METGAPFHCASHCAKASSMIDVSWAAGSAEVEDKSSGNGDEFHDHSPAAPHTSSTGEVTVPADTDRGPEWSEATRVAPLETGTGPSTAWVVVPAAVLGVDSVAGRWPATTVNGKSVRGLADGDEWLKTGEADPSELRPAVVAGVGRIAAEATRSGAGGCPLASGKE